MNERINDDVIINADFIYYVCFAFKATKESDCNFVAFIACASSMNIMFTNFNLTLFLIATFNWIQLSSLTFPNCMFHRIIL